MKRGLRNIVGSSRGEPTGAVRKIFFDYRDAIKCGFNTAGFTEVNTPAQDYRMVTMFSETTLKYFSLVSEKLRQGLLPVDTTNTTSAGVGTLVTSGGFFETDIPPFLMNYYLMNPSISPIEVWVEVWCVRRGFLPRISMADDYLRSSDDNDSGPVYSGVRWNLDNTQTALPPKIHNVTLASGAVANQLPMDEAKNANALLPNVMQIFSGNDSHRRRGYKLLSKRRRIVIPPGGVNKFRVKISIPRWMVQAFATDGTYPYFVGGDRLVVIKWSPLMGTVTGSLETTHFSEKVHLVVARKAKFVGIASSKRPTIHMQVVEQQGVTGTTRDYNTSAVTDHIQRMEVTKTAQQIETVP